jgi:hypothetical protein
VSHILNEGVNALAIAIEEGARAGKGNVSKFIEPAEGTLRRALSKRHHIIFGRRGSGKSSLLYKSADELAKSGNPVALVDLEPYKGHQYPDILISVLIATFRKYADWVKNEPIEKGERIWYTLYLRKGNSQKEKERMYLHSLIEKNIKELEEYLFLSDNATLTQFVSEGNREKTDLQIKAGGPFQDVTIGAVIDQECEASAAREVMEEFKRNKQDFLLRKMLDFQEIFILLYNINKKDCYLFLDDLYHLVRANQPELIDYFHRISKGNNLWIKIATIRNRTFWYKNTPQPIGVKLGDDAEEINLDLTLEKFSSSRSFLKSILNIYIQENKSPKIDDLLTEGGLDRLVLASGGVTRDFLGLFRRSIDETRERVKKSGPNYQRGEKIGAEDINITAGSYGELKKEEFQIDTLEDRDKLENAFAKVRQFCIDKSKFNIFLIAQDEGGQEIDLIRELIDLRLIHHVKSRVTVSSRPGKIFMAYLLDVSQYTGERAKRDIEMIEFWKDTEKEKIRRATLIYSPENYSIDNDSLPAGSSQDNKSLKKINSNKSNLQIDLGF